MEIKELDGIVVDVTGECSHYTSPVYRDEDVAYDSEHDIMLHIEMVEDLIHGVVDELDIRAREHDISKLMKKEKPIFDKYTPLLRGTSYGSQGYMNHLDSMGIALDHHYKKNRHHPEHHKKGIHGMNLIDLIEMLCDWKAASSRHEDGDIMKSLAINKDRFDYGEELNQLFVNTVRDLKWE